jgi:hypothetical protein
MKRIFSILTLISTSIILTSCGQAIVHKHLTDKIYLTAPDLIEQLSVSYNYSGSSYKSIVNETVIAVGYNDNFIIAKQRPSYKDTIQYYLINVNEIKQEREKFISKTDTIRWKTVYKDQNNNDSLGPEEIQISASKFSPNSADPLTIEEFKRKRKELNVPNDLDFSINYE